MGLLADYQLANGLSDESLAELLSERLEREIKPHGVRAMRARQDKNLAKSWLEALELELPPETIRESPRADLPGDRPPSDDGGGGDGAPGVGDLGARRALAPVELPFDGLEARKRIELIYVGIGEGLSRATRKPEYRLVFAQHAPSLAEKWIAASKQSARVAQLVTYVTTGGATGDLLIAHVTLAISLLIVSGKVPIGGIAGLGPDVVVPGTAPHRPPPPGDGRPAGAGPVRAVGDDAETPPR